MYVCVCEHRVLVYPARSNQPDRADTHTHTQSSQKQTDTESDWILQSDRGSGALDRLRLRFEVAFNSLLSATAAKCGIL